MNVRSAPSGFGGADGQQTQRSALGNSNGSGKTGSADGGNNSKSKIKLNSLGLSRSAKHLLVCAYLASHNSRDTGGWRRRPEDGGGSCLFESYTFSWTRGTGVVMGVVEVCGVWCAA